MVDAQVSPRELLRNLFWRPKFRSRREKVGYSIYGSVIAVLVVFPTTYFEWFGSFLSRLLWVVLLTMVLHIPSWAIWLFWGRRRFPLPAADGSKSTA